MVGLCLQIKKRGEALAPWTVFATLEYMSIHVLADTEHTFLCCSVLKQALWSSGSTATMHHIVESLCTVF